MMVNATGAPGIAQVNFSAFDDYLPNGFYYCFIKNTSEAERDFYITYKSAAVSGGTAGQVYAGSYR